MNTKLNPVRIFVGADDSQLLTVSVLEFSIQRHTKRPVELRSMHDLDLPQPKDPRNWARTGFSFTRFAIPALAGYSGRALYLDADMLVFRDISELYDMPFDGAKVIIQEEIPAPHRRGNKIGAPSQRVKQCSVMLLDCAALDWKVENIIAGLDGKYDYHQLMGELCILDEQDIKYGVPFHWNSLEAWNSQTGLIHYTDMGTQPWVSNANTFGYLWMNEVRLMLQSGALNIAEIEHEVERGHFRPSILEELKLPITRGPPERSLVERFEAIDRDAQFVKHAVLHSRFRLREKALRGTNRQSVFTGRSILSKLIRDAISLVRGGA